jgi:hypothetical protein
MVEASAGEAAAQAKDTSASQKALKSIMGKIIQTTSESKQMQSLNVINIGAAGFESSDIFDPVDMSQGSSATLKEGAALYSAALPTCIEMASEACDAEDLAIIQSAYKMAVEQDCNTVSKNYEQLRSAAGGKAKEASALLDMARLANHQERNSGDIKSCTKAMMDIINTDAVCGAGLEKCMDWTGKYVNPLTGGAILTPSLADLAGTLTRPSGDAKWADVAANSDMISFLESKKTYIEPAMADCESIRAAAWGNFVETALPQIKIAQDARLEEMRQNCTSMIGQCKSGAAKSINDFDARALSIFGVSADFTVGKMCSDVQTACSALMTRANGDGEYGKAVEKIDLAKTYATILQTCNLVGKECVKRSCSDGLNDFGLCMFGQNRVRRILLQYDIEKNHCKEEVRNCIKQADEQAADGAYDSNLVKICELNPRDFFKTTFETPAAEECKRNTHAGVADKLTDNIWGGCEKTDLDWAKNKIEIPDSTKNPNETVLSWFDQNTLTSGRNPGMEGSCSPGNCIDGKYKVWWYDADNGWKSICSEYGSTGYEACSFNEGKMGHGGSTSSTSTNILPGDTVIYINFINDNNTVPPKLRMKDDPAYSTNCCASGKKDLFGNCCSVNTANGVTGDDTTDAPGTPVKNLESTTNGSNGPCDPSKMCCWGHYGADNSFGSAVKGNYCAPDDFTFVARKTSDANYKGTGTSLFCQGGLDNTPEIECKGSFVTVDSNGIYRTSTGCGDCTEKYMNYIYYNMEDKYHSGTDLSKTHRLLVWITGEWKFFNPNYDNPSQSSWIPMSNVTLPEMANFSCNMVSNILSCSGSGFGHQVKYCEYGLKIVFDKTNGQEHVECCQSNSNKNCKTYQIEDKDQTEKK